jgi:hypothetical protein
VDTVSAAVLVLGSCTAPRLAPHGQPASPLPASSALPSQRSPTYHIGPAKPFTCCTMASGDKSSSKPKSVLGRLRGAFGSSKTSTSSSGPSSSSLAHGIHQASAVASTPAAPRPTSAAIPPPEESSERTEEAIMAIARTRAILGIAEKALDACPVIGPKAVVAAISEGLKMFEVRICKCSDKNVH